MSLIGLLIVGAPVTIIGSKYIDDEWTGKTGTVNRFYGNPGGADDALVDCHDGTTVVMTCDRLRSTLVID